MKSVNLIGQYMAQAAVADEWMRQAVAAARAAGNEVFYDEILIQEKPKMKTSELSGALLDFWTARAEGVAAADLEIRAVQRPDPRTPDTICIKKIGQLALMRIDYSTNWALTGPLLEKRRFTVCAAPEGKWTIPHVGFAMYGDTPLIAICRAVVRAAFGDEVEDLPCA